VANTGENVRAVPFDLLAAAAAIAQLAAVEFAIDEFEIDRKSCGQAGKKGE
jgi:hypothetical protein